MISIWIEIEFRRNDEWAEVFFVWQKKVFQTKKGLKDQVPNFLLFLRTIHGKRISLNNFLDYQQMGIERVIDE